jgi:hypothetical protein
MPRDLAALFFERVQVGTPVTVVGSTDNLPRVRIYCPPVHMCCVSEVCLAPKNGRSRNDGFQFDLNDFECPKTEPNLPSNEGSNTQREHQVNFW